MHNKTLIFVYNADTGWFNLASDIAHKIFSPATYPCSLCALTHGVFAVRPQWEAFVQKLETAPVFLHRDEFLRTHPDWAETPLPLVLHETDAGLEILLTAAALNRMQGLNALIEVLDRKR